MIFRRIRALGWVIGYILLAAVVARAAPGYGKLSGVVVDPAGTPQMGATVWVLAENARGTAVAQLFTNERGLFASTPLPPGLYSVRVSLAGFLPALARHVHISSNITTLVKIELDSVFASIDRLRRSPVTSADPDEWKWVLRTSAATRPVLQWVQGDDQRNSEIASSEPSRGRRQHGRLELTSGARRPGSVSNLADSPATAFSYDQRIGRTSRLLLAGQMSYERSAAAGFATMWLPAGELGHGPETAFVLRQAKLGPSGPVFRGMRVEHSRQLAIGDSLALRYGAEYVMVGLGSATATSSLRPHTELSVRLSPNWQATLIASATSGKGAPVSDSEGNLQVALGELDAFPAVLWRNGHPVLEGGWHQELNLQRRLGGHARIEAAAFRDRWRHAPIFGRGTTTNPEFLKDFFSEAFLYDGGGLNSWGTRLAYRQKISEDLELTVVYAWAGALTVENLAADIALRDALQTRYRHSLAARLSGHMPKVGTRIVASYKWIQGPVVSRQDVFGEAAYQLEPNLSLSIRQPLPGSLCGGHWEALADFHNLLAEGYVRTSGYDGQLLLVPVVRSIRGGVSFQF